MDNNGCTKNPPRRIYINALILHLIVAIFVGYNILVISGLIITQSLLQIGPIGVYAIKSVTFVGIGLGTWVTWAALKNPVYVPMLCLMDQTLDALWDLVKRHRADK